MIFLVAGLKEIPVHLYEAAEIDGASLLQQIFWITVPLLKRIILFVFVVNTSSNFLLFAPMYIITRGGPEFSTNVLMFEAYNSGFVSHNIGRAMAITLILISIMLVSVGVQFKFLSSKLEN
jgi:multiple sugar transport system permease protein